MSDVNYQDMYTSACAQRDTYKDQIDRLKEDARSVLDTFAARKKSDGSFVIDFDAFVQKLGPETALELRKAIDEVHNISGAAGEKPRMRLSA